MGHAYSKTQALVVTPNGGSSNDSLATRNIDPTHSATRPTIASTACGAHLGARTKRCCGHGLRRRSRCDEALDGEVASAIEATSRHEYCRSCRCCRGHALNALKRPIEPLAATRCSVCRGNARGGARPFVRRWPKVAGARLPPAPPLIYLLSNEVLLPERAGCRDRFVAG